MRMFQNQKRGATLTRIGHTLGDLQDTSLYPNFVTARSKFVSLGVSSLGLKMHTSCPGYCNMGKHVILVLQRRCMLLLPKSGI